MRHLDYMVARVGADHVGIGLDYVYAWSGGPYSGAPAGSTETLQDMRHAEPEQLPALIQAMARAGYRPADIEKIAWGNFARVAAATWTQDAGGYPGAVEHQAEGVWA